MTPSLAQPTNPAFPGRKNAYEGEQGTALRRRSRPSRYVRPAESPPLSLQERDRRLLATLYAYRTLTALHLHALVFGDVSRQAVQLRLRKLWAHAFLERTYLPLALDGRAPTAAAGGPVYTLGRRGAAVVSELLRRRVKVPTISLVALPHHLIAIEFLIALRAACRDRPEVVVAAAEPEPTLWRKLAAHGHPAGYLVPDAAVTLAPGLGRPSTVYLEVVRADVRGGNRTLLRRLRRYATLNHAGRFRTLYGHEHLRAVLILTTSDERAEHFRLLARRLPHGHRLFWFGTYRTLDADGRERTTLTPATMLEPRWRTVEGALRSLIPPDAVAPTPGSAVSNF